MATSDIPSQAFTILRGWAIVWETSRSGYAKNLKTGRRYPFKSYPKRVIFDRHHALPRRVLEATDAMNKAKTKIK